MSHYAESLHEVFESFGRITLRRMFGGHGVFRDGLMFGLVIHDCLYLKADATTMDKFTAKDLQPFEYQSQDKVVRVSYYEAPPEIFEDRQEAAAWARLAWDATLRAKASKPKRQPKRQSATPRKRAKPD